MKELGAPESISERFISNFMTVNERHIYFIMRTVLLHEPSAEDRDSALIFRYLSASPAIRGTLAAYAKENFQAYKGIVSEGHKEWANKVYLITYKMISVFETVNEATDVFWKIDVALFEIRNWILQLHLTINKSDVEDDWHKIERFINQETDRVEWKSSFYVSVEGPFISNEIEKNGAKQTLQPIVRTMLGMMNEGGGTIIVGLVENPDRIIREDIRNNLMLRNRVTLFDIQWELDRLDRTLDNVKRDIIDGLKDVTLLTADAFNGLWTIDPIVIKDELRGITVYKLNIAASPEPIFSAKAEGGSVSISLIKRANGRTIQVDPRQVFTKKPA